MREAAHIDDFVEDQEPRHILMQEKELEVVEIKENPEDVNSTPAPMFSENEDPAVLYPQEIED